MKRKLVRHILCLLTLSFSMSACGDKLSEGGVDRLPNGQVGSNNTGTNSSGGSGGGTGSSGSGGSGGGGSGMGGGGGFVIAEEDLPSAIN